MALRDLVEGECGRANSLVQLTSHFVRDRAHKEDGLRHAPSYHEDVFTNDDADQLVREFLGETLRHSPQTFRMDSLLREMREMESAASQHAPVQAPGVAALASLAGDDPAWTQEYLGVGKHLGEELHDQDIWSTGERIPQSVEGFDFKEYPDTNLNNDENWLQHSDIINSRQNEFQGRRNLFLDYPRVNYLRPPIGDGVVIENMPSEEVENTWVDDIVHNLSHSETVERSAETGPSVVTSEETLPNKESVHDDSSAYSSDLWLKLSESWQQLFNPGEQAWGSEFSEYNDQFKEYPFESENPMAGQSNALEEGKRRLEAGDLAGAVLCFEAAVQLDPKSSEAWQLLGMSQAENEQDPQAISALKTCLSLDPANLKALMAIAISYTNESYPYHAFHFLKEWLRQNPNYSHLVPKLEGSQQPPKMIPSFPTGDIHKEVQDLYIVAARLHPNKDIDPDVQCGLGVLFNLSKEYDKAVDCFKAALQVRQSDSRIWNRLGATLANGDRSEEAVDAYHHALALSPGYIRARYNVGITCINLSAYKEATEHFLTALNQQAQAKGITETTRTSMSDSIWGTLRLVISMQNRQDLYKVVDDRDLLKLNEIFGINL